MSAHQPDPQHPHQCKCGGQWARGKCILRDTLHGASYEYHHAARALARAIAAAVEPRIARLEHTTGTLAGLLKRLLTKGKP